MAEATNLCIQLGEVQMVNGLRSRSGKAGGIGVGSGFAREISGGRRRWLC